MDSYGARIRCVRPPSRTRGVAVATLIAELTRETVQQVV